MEGKYKYELQNYYPHMKPADIAIWNRYVSKFPSAFTTCDYDVLVGKGVVVGDPKTDPYSKSFQILTQKKIDVVGYKDDEIWIIEVKPRAGASALGQVIGYLDLWTREHPDIPKTNVFPCVLTDEAQSDFESVYANAGVMLIEINKL